MSEVQAQGQHAILGLAIAEARDTIKQAEAKLRKAMGECLSRRSDVVMVPLVRRAAWLCEGMLEVSSRD